MRKNRFGLSVALATPFTDEWLIDLPRLVAHGRQSLADGCTSLTLFGTTGEGASLGLNERQRALGALAGAGVDPRTQLVVGIAASSVEDAIAQGRAALMLGCPSFLLAPPFYFKGAGDEGLFDWFAAVLTGLGPKASNVILYHIPQVTSVGLSVGLIDRLKKAFPGQVSGVKDSSGDWANSQALLKHHADLHILIGDERLLAKAMKLGASGTICGLANIAPDLMQAPVNGIEEPRIAEIIEQLVPFAFTAACKALVGHRRNDPVAWSRMRAPLRSLNEVECRALFAAIDAIRAKRAA
ncbi:dihydrodipicolinate synthase family protein [Reyranella sp.]|uniref:dihydrodipicolinate synthase family protein n=1 Tax=Reyranella sp. TaxID=1929291 RepID=UPI0027315797|nr:dihydrodipicolinate synthase family protein [Reyranella sp.]MDP2373852.1 dihydrodipicolinate synthase family protein [Reyranella sp.]